MRVVHTLKCLLGIGFLCIGFSLTGMAQGELVPFRARFLYKNMPVQDRIGGRVEGGGSFVTDSNGEISLKVDKTDEVRIMLTEDNWQLRFPENGFVPVPRDSNTFAQIILAHPGENDASTALLKKLKKLQASSQAENEEILTEIKLVRDSLAHLFDQRTLEAVEQQMAILEQIRLENERADSIQAAKERLVMTEGRLKMLGLLTSATDHFITRAKDLRDEFKARGKKALLNGSAVQQLTARINAYSEAYEELNQHENEIKDLLDAYWEEDLTIYKTEGLLDFALNDVHKQTNLSANSLIEDIQNFRDPRVKKKNKRRKPEIERDIGEFVFDLNNLIDELTDRKSEVFQLLNEI